MGRFAKITLLIAIGVIAATLATWFLWRFFTKTPQPEETPLSFPVAPTQPEIPGAVLPEVEAEAPPETFYRRDTDGDTVPDWEETLWGTNPENRDTDGDGVADREEIARRRAPQETFIRDLLPRDALPITPTTPPAPLLGQEGRDRVEAETTPSTARQPAPPLPRLPSPEIIALRSYAAVTETVIQTYASRWQTEVNAFEMFATTSAPEGNAAALRRVAEGYRARAGDLAKIAPPAPARALHEALIARYRGQADAIDLVASRGAFEDVSGDDWNVYAKAVVGAGRAYLNLAQFLSAQNASFPGATF